MIMAKSSKNAGYGRPPASKQFKPGKSGNPRGRPKGTKNFKSDLTEELSQKVLLTEDGRQSRISKQRAMIKSLMAKAVQGDGRAADTVIKLVENLVTEDSYNHNQNPLNEDDQVILDLFLARNKAGGSSDE
jgi:hypothetical protein